MLDVNLTLVAIVRKMIIKKNKFSTSFAVTVSEKIVVAYLFTVVCFGISYQLSKKSKVNE